MHNKSIYSEVTALDTLERVDVSREASGCWHGEILRYEV